MFFNKMKKQFLTKMLALLLIISLAACNSEKKTFTIKWDIEGVTSTTIVNKGETPNYDGTTPVKVSTAEFDYTFSGWLPAIVAATSNATYVAQFTSAIRSYTITWNVEGIISTTSVTYGTTPTYNGAMPTKASAAGLDYTFSGWAPAITSVTGVATYTAQFTTTNNGTLRAKPITLLLDKPTTAVITGNEQKYEGKNGQWYSFTPNITGNYVIKATTATPADCDVYLFDSLTDVHKAYDDFGSIFYRFRLEYELTAGTTYYYFVTFYEAQSGEITFEIYQIKTAGELAQTINNAEGEEYMKAMIELRDMGYNGDQDSLNVCANLDITKLQLLAENVNLAASSILLDLADEYFCNAAARNALEHLDITNIVPLAEGGSYDALSFLLSLKYYGNTAAESALNNLDISTFKAQAENGDVDSAYALMFLDGSDNRAAAEAIENLDVTALVNLAKNADAVAVYIIYYMAKNYKHAAAIAAKDDILAALIILAENGSIDAVYSLFSLADFVFISGSILTNLDVKILIENAENGDYDAQFVLSVFAEYYKNVAAIEYMASIQSIDYLSDKFA